MAKERNERFRVHQENAKKVHTLMHGHSDEMIQRLEQAGLGYHIQADATVDKLGIIPHKRSHIIPSHSTQVTGKLWRNHVNYCVRVTACYFYLRSSADASLGVPRAAAATEHATAGVGLRTTQPGHREKIHSGNAILGSPAEKQVTPHAANPASSLLDSVN